mmetsp:Transcript_5854/g.8582  ORF Transcript_5854/g.8582 Transcript_5854/m.8582 type:complete len:308 (+) Transcript_5854:659-1582(+)
MNPRRRRGRRYQPQGTMQGNQGLGIPQGGMRRGFVNQRMHPQLARVMNQVTPMITQNPYNPQTWGYLTNQLRSLRLYRISFRTQILMQHICPEYHIVGKPQQPSAPKQQLMQEQAPPKQEHYKKKETPKVVEKKSSKKETKEAEPSVQSRIVQRILEEQEKLKNKKSRGVQTQSLSTKENEKEDLENKKEPVQFNKKDHPLVKLAEKKARQQEVNEKLTLLQQLDVAQRELKVVRDRSLILARENMQLKESKLKTTKKIDAASQALVDHHHAIQLAQTSTTKRRRPIKKVLQQLDQEVKRITELLQE